MHEKREKSLYKSVRLSAKLFRIDKELFFFFKWIDSPKINRFFLRIVLEYFNTDYFSYSKLVKFNSSLPYIFLKDQTILIGILQVGYIYSSI